MFNMLTALGLYMRRPHMCSHTSAIGLSDEVSGTITRQAPASSLASLLPRQKGSWLLVGCAGSISSISKSPMNTGLGGPIKERTKYMTIYGIHIPDP
jgi:hypothetical protein